ncbi:MAG: hypothetical protein ACI9KE_001485 [Polyangiales bacterium]
MGYTPRFVGTRQRSLWLPDSDIVADMIQTLDREDRLRLMKFVCSFAWADLEIQDEERAFIGRLVTQLELDDAETAQVDEWLKLPPTADELDPAEIPVAHRELFLETARAMIVSDGKIDADEAENFALFELLVR